MMTSLLQMGLSNAFMALALAVVAAVVGSKVKRPHLVHLLWLLVFVKLVTPSIVSIPVVPLPEDSGAAMLGGAASPMGQLDHRTPATPATAAPAPAGHAVDGDTMTSALGQAGAVVVEQGRRWLPPIWLLGSALVFCWSLFRVIRFNRILAAESEEAGPELRAVAGRIARQLGLKKVPMICTTTAHVSPMVWWAGGAVRVVIPEALLGELDRRQWHWVLAHELAHVRRRDHVVRWLEWLACVCFWWNPVVWWAQWNLRAAEEICCDALVLSALRAEPRGYANALLKAVEFFACPVLRPPAMASEVNSGGCLERRFRMIVSTEPKRSNSRVLHAGVLLCAALVLPFGLGYAQDYEAVERRLGEAVSHGELSLEDAAAMMKVLQKEAGKERAGVKGAKGAKGAKKAAAKKGMKKGAKQRESKEKWDADHEGIWRKLEAEVDRGTLRKEQAEAKMAAMKRKAAGGDAAMQQYGATLLELKEAVDRGVLSQEQAEAKWAAIQDGAEEKELRLAEYDAIEASVRAAVRVGELSRRGGEQKLIAAREELFGEKALGRAHSDELGARLKEESLRLKEAVEAGKLSEEEANEHWAAIERKGREAKYRAAEMELQAAVKAGEISKRDARLRLEEMRRAMAGSSKGGEAEMHDRIVQALLEHGIAREQVERIVDMAHHIADEMRDGGDARALHHGLQKRLEHMGLSAEQMELIHGITRRIAHAG